MSVIRLYGRMGKYTHKEGLKMATKTLVNVCPEEYNLVLIRRARKVFQSYVMYEKEKGGCNPIFGIKLQDEYYANVVALAELISPKDMEASIKLIEFIVEFVTPSCEVALVKALER
jgi:hypothetical protein